MPNMWAVQPCCLSSASEVEELAWVLIILSVLIYPIVLDLLSVSCVLRKHACGGVHVCVRARVCVEMSTCWYQ